MQEKITYDIPPEFTDDEKWLKYLSTKQAKVFVATGVVTILLWKAFRLFGHPIIGIVLGLILMAVCMVVVTIEVPEENYLKGGGLTLDIILSRHFIRFASKCIYVLGNNDYADEEDD